VALVDIIMPQMGESIAEGTLSKWLKKVGDEVKRDEPIFEISTDKVDAEIPAPSAGVIAEIIVKEGETVAVQTVVARMETEKGAFTGAPAKEAEAVVTATPEAKTAEPAATIPEPAAKIAEPAAKVAAPSSHNGSSFEERIRTRSSPLVRKMAAEHGFDLRGLQGSGIAGRVTKKDLMGFINGGIPDSARVSMHAPTGVGGEDYPLPEPWPGDRVETMSKMRALISDHMIASRRTSAHVTSFMEVDFTRIARIRARKRVEFEAATGEKLTYMPFIIASVVQGLKAFPILNSSVSGNNIIYRRPINIGVAVALDWGLIVPVIKNSENLSLAGITRALNDLASRARVKKLSPEEVQDATFTITNHGVFGSLIATPIISQPQVAILGIGAIEKRPKILPGRDGEDTIAIRTCAYFSISFDHRVIDGAVADQFLGYVKTTLEEYPETGV
jgi:pyruvate dehydrogenase E2 component (dihydrolipoamide acetyltransferase)